MIPLTGCLQVLKFVLRVVTWGAFLRKHGLNSILTACTSIALPNGSSSTFYEVYCSSCREMFVSTRTRNALQIALCGMNAEIRRAALTHRVCLHGVHLRAVRDFSMAEESRSDVQVFEETSLYSFRKLNLALVVGQQR